jgi:hypothetical protein
MDCIQLDTKSASQNDYLKPSRITLGEILQKVVFRSWDRFVRQARARVPLLIADFIAIYPDIDYIPSLKGKIPAMRPTPSDVSGCRPGECRQLQALGIAAGSGGKHTNLENRGYLQPAFDFNDLNRLPSPAVTPVLGWLGTAKTANQARTRAGFSRGFA